MKADEGAAKAAEIASVQRRRGSVSTAEAPRKSPDVTDSYSVLLESTGTEPHSNVKITRGDGGGGGGGGSRASATVGVSRIADHRGSPKDDVDPVELLLCAWLHQGQAEATAVGVAGSKQESVRFEASPLVTWEAELDFNPEGRTVAALFPQLWMAGYPNSRATQREVLDVYAAVQRRCFVDTLLKAAHIEATGPAWKTQKGATLPKRKDLSAFAESGECPVCRKQVYAMEELVVERVKYHKACFKCASGGCRLSASNYARALDGAVYCKPHFMAAFKEKGDYQTAFSSSNPAPENAGPNSYRIVVHGSGNGGRTELTLGARTVKVALDEANGRSALNAPGAVLAAAASSLQQSALRIIDTEHAAKAKGIAGISVRGVLDVRRDGDDGNLTVIDRVDLAVSVTGAGGEGVSWLPRAFGSSAEASCPVSLLLRAAGVPLKIVWT